MNTMYVTKCTFKITIQITQQQRLTATQHNNNNSNTIITILTITNYTSGRGVWIILYWIVLYCVDWISVNRERNQMCLLSPTYKTPT